MSGAPADFVSLHQPAKATNASFKSSRISPTRKQSYPELKEQLGELMHVSLIYVYILLN